MDSASIIGDSGIVYFGSEVDSNGKRFHALNAASGDVIWEIPMNQDITWSSPFIYNNLIYIGTMGGYIYAIEME